MSEFLKQEPDLPVRRFLAGDQVGSMDIPSIVVAELRYGIERLPPGRRRQLLQAALVAFLARGFAGRVLPFDVTCAVGYAFVRASCEAIGRPVSVQDALIGGMALTHAATLATRNVADFDGYGLTVVNPWETV